MTNISSSSGLGRPYASHAHQDAVFNMQMSVCSVLQRLMYNPFTFDNREIGKPNSYIPDLVLLADYNTPQFLDNSKRKVFIFEK